jgi:putative peptide zinc metalloprotease protein
MNTDAGFPCIAADVVVDPPAGAHRIVCRTSTRRYFRLGVREGGFLAALDGRRDPAALAADMGFTAAQVEALLAWFGRNGLLAGSGAAPTAAALPWHRRALEALAHTDRWRVTLANPDRFLDRHRRAVGALFSRAAMAAYLALLLLPAVACIVAPGLLGEAYRAYRLDLPWTQWALLYAMLLAMNVLHELAHAATCKHFGGKVEKIGLMFMYLQPVLYCDVSDSWRFRDPNQRIAVAAAGIFLQFVLGGLVLTAWLFTASPVLLLFCLVNVALALLNLFPLVKLDGYWMLVHALDEPNLRQRGLESLDTAFRALVGRPRAGARPLEPAALAFGVGHAVAVPAFWLLGLWGLHRLVARASEPLALGLVAMFAAPLLYRALRAAIAYAGALRAPLAAGETR